LVSESPAQTPRVLERVGERDVWPGLELREELLVALKRWIKPKSKDCRQDVNRARYNLINPKKTPKKKGGSDCIQHRHLESMFTN